MSLSEYLDARLRRAEIEIIIATIMIVGLGDAALFWGLSILLQHKFHC
jgi:hypothetical protein